MVAYCENQNQDRKQIKIKRAVLYRYLTRNINDSAERKRCTEKGCWIERYAINWKSIIGSVWLCLYLRHVSTSGGGGKCGGAIFLLEFCLN